MAHTQTTDDPRVTLLDGTDGAFRVESRTRPGLEHTVSVPDGTCTCEAGQHGVACWHLDFCRAVYYWHRYDRRAQLWTERAAQLAATRTTGTAARARPAGMTTRQEGWTPPAR